MKNPTYEGIETAYENLKRAMEDLSYAHVENPFDLITEVAAKATLKEGETQELFVLPEAVKDLVTVLNVSFCRTSWLFRVRLFHIMDMRRRCIFCYFYSSRRSREESDL